MLKTLLQTAFTILVFFNFAIVSADTIPPKPPTTGGDLPPVISGGRSTTRPDNVTANYNGEVVSIVFEQGEGEVWVEVSDSFNNPVHEGSYNSAAPIIIPIQAVEAPLLIYISTDFGNEYEGWIQ